jgi:fructokinase
VLWDELPDGRQLGGAPANFAYHTAALGASSSVVSRVGADDAGLALRERLDALGVSAHAIELDPRRPTSTVTVELGADGQPRYVIHEGVAWDFLAGEKVGRVEVVRADAICFGTLAQRHPVARAALHQLLQLADSAALRVFDVNLRQQYYSREIIAASLDAANVLKLNETELPVLREMFGLPADDRGALASLAARHRLRAVLYTRGERGCLALADGTWHEHPGTKVEVADTVGAGDSFTAAFTLGLLRRWPLALIVERATAISAYVCTQRGATPALPPELTKLFGVGGG